MASTAIALATKDNASGNLATAITDSGLTITLQSGQGANFPQPYNGTATSAGTSTTLYRTGILATIGSGAVGKFIRNTTDGSVACIKSVGTDVVGTSPLLDGGTNQWNSGDAWRIDEFVATLAQASTSSYGVTTISAYEEVLVIARSTDTLTVAAGGRGYNGTTAAAFGVNDYVYLFVTALIIERLKDVIFGQVKALCSASTLQTVYTSDSTQIGTSSTAEANFDSSHQINAQFWSPGAIFRVSAVVTAVVNNSDNFTLRLKLGSTTLMSKQYTNATAGVRNAAIWVQYEIVCLTGGATGTLHHYGSFSLQTLSTDFTGTNDANEYTFGGKFPSVSGTDPSTTTDTFDLTSNLTLLLSIQYGGSSANNKAKQNRMHVERMLL